MLSYLVSRASLSHSNQFCSTSLFPGKPRTSVYKIPINEDGVPILPLVDVQEASATQVAALLDEYILSLWGKSNCHLLNQMSKPYYRFLLGWEWKYTCNSMGGSRPESPSLFRHFYLQIPLHVQVTSSLEIQPFRDIRCVRISFIGFIFYPLSFPLLFGDIEVQFLGWWRWWRRLAAPPTE